MADADSGALLRDQEAEKARAALLEARTELETARARISDARADLARLVSLRESLGRRAEDSGRRLERVLEDTGTANARAQELGAKIKTFSSALSELVQTRLDLGARAEDFEGRAKELTGKAQGLEAQVETLRTELHRRRSRLQSLKEIQDKYEGFDRGTRAVMQAPGEIGTEAEEIRGLVADFVEAPAALEVAVEAALGDRLGGIVVESPKVGAKAIDYLKRTSSGRSGVRSVPRSARRDRRRY